MTRGSTISKLYEKKFQTFTFSGIWKTVLGNPETNGAWIIYGKEKNGKTWFTLLLASYLSVFSKVWYISAEEGKSKPFVDAMRRAQLDPNNRSLTIHEYMSIDELSERLKRRKSPGIVIIDNVTMYQDELKNGVFRKLLKQHPNKLLIFVAHEERGEPYGATGKLIKKLSKIVIRTQGLQSFIGGRCPGGQLSIDEEKSTLYHGTNSN